MCPVCLASLATTVAAATGSAGVLAAAVALVKRRLSPQSNPNPGVTDGSPEDRPEE